MGINLLAFDYYKTMRETRAEEGGIYDSVSAISFKLIIYLSLNHATEDHRKKIITQSIPYTDQILDVHLGIHILNCGCIFLCGHFYLSGRQVHKVEKGRNARLSFLSPEILPFKSCGVRTLCLALPNT